MKTRASVVWRGIVVASVLGLVVGSVLGTASADLASFNSQANAFALRMTVDLRGLPQALKDQINGAWQAAPGNEGASWPCSAGQTGCTPFVVDQFLNRTTSTADATTKATSVLGDGFKDLGSVSAEAVGEEKTNNPPNVSLPPKVQDLDASVLDAVGGLLKAKVSAGPSVEANAALTSVLTSIRKPMALLPDNLRDAVNAVFEGVNAKVNEAISQANSALDSAASAVVAALPPQVTNDPVLGPLVQDGTTLASNLNIPSVTVNPVTDGIAQASDLVATATAQRTADGRASADATSSLKAFDAFGGLLRVSAVNLAAHSEAGGVAGSAKNTSRCDLVDLRVGGNTGASLDGRSVYVEVDGKPVALPVPADQVATVKSSVDAILNQAGIAVTLCGSTGQADPAGTSSSQQVSGFAVEIAPKVPDAATLPPPLQSTVQDAITTLGLTPGQPLGIVIRIDPTVQSAAAASAQSSPAQLPRTGANVLATLAMGAALGGAGLGLRRWAR